ncbi:MAG: hypothetical protein H6999_05315 [Hahellaceae bacterium]|nr:hypothetical protein [Hahellaceae bacterium]MCP5169157.1 hypothetical protein [Hahellaceae bacterium]
MTNKDRLLLALVLIPTPLMFMGMPNHVELALGFTTPLALHAMRRILWVMFVDVFKNPETAFNVWLGILLCQMASTTQASLNLYDSILPGIALAMAGLTVSQLLSPPALMPGKPTEDKNG